MWCDVEVKGPYRRLQNNEGGQQCLRFVMVGGEIKGDCGESARRMPGTKGGILYVSAAEIMRTSMPTDVINISVRSTSPEEHKSSMGAENNREENKLLEKVIFVRILSKTN